MPRTAEARPAKLQPAETKLSTEAMAKPVSDLMRGFKSFLKDDQPYQLSATYGTLYPRDPLYNIRGKDAVQRKTQVTFPRAKGSCKVASYLDHAETYYLFINGNWNNEYTLIIEDVQPQNRTTVTLSGFIKEVYIEKFDEEAEDFGGGSVKFERVTIDEAGNQKTIEHHRTQAAINATWEFFQEFIAPAQPDQASLETSQQ